MHHRIVLNTVIIIIALFTSCKKDIKDKLPDIPGNEVQAISKNNRVIYEINVRNYSAAGNFAGVEKDLPRLKDLGIDILWLMPIHPIGVLNRQGTLGSPYAVKDYKSINPDLGTAADLTSLIQAAHKDGMEVWLDWVGNHTAWDHPWVQQHLDYYAERNGQRPYSPENWTDVVQLDYNNSNLRVAMIDALKYWVSEFNIDGYRCDAATFIPVSFWKEARQQVDAVKPITWLCEGDNAAYMEAFDYDYAWSFNTALNNLGSNTDVSKLVAACNLLVGNPDYAKKGRMIYLTNHDLNAYDGTEISRYGNNVLPLTVLYFTVYDMPLIYNGQEIGWNTSMNLFDASPIDWQQGNMRYYKLFKKLTQLKRTQPALESGLNRVHLSRYTTNHDDKVFVYSKTKGNSEVLVMLNFSNNPVRFKLSSYSPNGAFYNFLSGERQTFSTTDPITLEANGYAIYVKQ